MTENEKSMTDDDDPFQTNDSMDTDEGSAESALSDYMAEATRLTELATPLVNCRVEGCTVQTDRPTGYCKAHEEEFKTTMETRVLRCSECPQAVQDICEFKDKTSGMCHYEVTLKAEDFSMKESMAAEFRKLINSARILIGRIERAIGADPKDQSNAYLMAEIRHQRDSFVRLQMTYNKFMGWDKDVRGKADKIERLKTLQRVVGSKTIAPIIAKDKVDQSPELQHIKVEGLIVGEENGPPIPSDIQASSETQPSDDDPTEDFVDEEANSDDSISDDLQDLEALEADAKREPAIIQSDDDGSSHSGDYDSGFGSGAIKRKVGRR